MQANVSMIFSTNFPLFCLFYMVISNDFVDLALGILRYTSSVMFGFLVLSLPLLLMHVFDDTFLLDLLVHYEMIFYLLYFYRALMC